MTSIRTINEFLESPRWTAAEKSVIKWQFRLHGDFHTALWDAIKRADDGNLSRISAGFPDEIAGYIAWTRGGLAGRLREAGLGI